VTHLDRHAVDDVEYAAAAERASLIIPAPDRVGPMTIVVLLAQTIAAAQAHSAVDVSPQV
jgi:methylenetetrahydrofolate dehydrogenase (NADP+)/methenyltetrahydrofolate cyclohydrolase